MASRKDDPFALSSGLPDDVDCTFGEAYFSTNAEYNKGATLCLHIPYECDDAEVDTDKPLLFACGDGWEAEDRGAKAVDEKGNADRTFSGASGMGLLLKHAFEAGAEDIIRERAGDDGPYSAEIWNGLKFHMKRVEHGKGQYKSERLYPAEFLGEEATGVKANGKASGAKASGGKSTSKAAATKEAPPEDDATEGGAPTLTTKEKIKLRDFAKKVKKDGGTHEQYVELVVGEYGDDLPPAMEADVLDEDNADSVWGSTSI